MTDLTKIAAAYAAAEYASAETNDLHVASSALLGGLLSSRWNAAELDGAVAAARGAEAAKRGRTVRDTPYEPKSHLGNLWRNAYLDEDDKRVAKLPRAEVIGV